MRARAQYAPCPSNPVRERTLEGADMHARFPRVSSHERTSIDLETSRSPHNHTTTRPHNRVVYARLSLSPPYDRVWLPASLHEIPLHVVKRETGIAMEAQESERRIAVDDEPLGCPSLHPHLSFEIPGMGISRACAVSSLTSPPPSSRPSFAGPHCLLQPYALDMPCPD